MIRPLTNWLVVTVTIFVLQAVGAALFGVKLPEFAAGSSGATAPSLLFVCSLVSDALIAAVIMTLARHASVRGGALVAGLFAVTFGIGHATAMIEGYVFGILTGAESLRILGMMALTSLGASMVAARLTDSATPEASRHSGWWPSPLPLAIVAALYLVAYFTAGMLVYPFIERFYAQRSLPPVGAIAALQFFVRGPIFGLILAWVVGSTTGSRAARAWRAGVAMSVLGGIAPLVMPNPYFPDAVRWAHLVETSTSNFLFGVIAGWLLSRPLAGSAAARTSVDRPASIEA